jgi:hypothetical protein
MFREHALDGRCSHAGRPHSLPLTPHPSPSLPASPSPPSCHVGRAARVAALQVDGAPADSHYHFVSRGVAVSRRQEARFLATDYLPSIEIASNAPGAA